MSKIKAVIFDYGNVISVLQDEHSLRAISEATGLPEDAFAGAYDNHAFRNAFDRGDITGAELYSRVIAAKGFVKESRDMALMEKAMKIDLAYWHNTNPQVIEWGLQLKNEGYKLGILSNMPHEFLDAYENLIPLFVEADYACFSCRVGMIKPEEAIYRNALEGLGVQPDEAVFFDDLPENIAAANKIGIHGVLWTGSIDEAKKSVGTVPELLAPAGSVEALNAAIGEGADAVYLGLKTFNARLRTQNFSWREAEAATQALHKLGKKLFITVNTVCTEDETEELYRFLSYIDKIKCDGIIVQDFAVIRMVQEFFPHINVHASTQMAVASSAAVNRLSKNGVKRVVLARELSLEEIRSVKEHTSCEIEVFVHGALCVSCSGLCMFSSYLGGKSANRGMCTQACRRLYKAYSFSENEKKAYFFSPNDLELIAAVPDLVSAGVDSFKIEGRMKSAEYVGAVTAAYRHVLDNYQDDAKAAIETAKRILASDFGRSKTRYWFDARQSGANLAEESRGIAEKTLNPEQAGGTGIYLGKLKDAANGFAHLSGDYVPEAGDTIRIHRSDDSGRVSHKLKDVTVSDSGVCKIDIPQALAPAGGFKSGDDVYLLQTKQMTKRYAQALPRDLKKFYAKPDNLQLPILDLTPSQHELPGRENARIERENARIDEKKFPEGVYIQVSTLRDLHACLAEHPVRLILELNHETFSALCRKKIAPPVSPRQLFLSLDPFCPESQERDTENYVHELIAMGYTNWIVNSLSHFAFFRSGENRSENRTENRCFLVGGPYLYVFNRWAASFLENQGVSAFIPAIENSQKNIESIFEMNVRAKVLVTVFSYPALFRIRFPLPADYDFVYFEDKEGEVFKALSGEDGSFVLPEKPFCVTSSASKLLNAGFKRVLIDYSKTQVQKKDLKKVLQSLYQSKPLSETERFNWKEGFYTTRDRALPPEAHQNQPARHGGRYAR